MAPVTPYLNSRLALQSLQTQTHLSNSVAFLSMEAKMMHNFWLLMLAILLPVLIVQASQVSFKDENGVKTAVYLSPVFVMGAGSVANKVFNNIDFPKGHIGIKQFNGEVVDEAGNPVPLYETYLHHWVVIRYATRVLTYQNGTQELSTITLPNSGVCHDGTLAQYFGLGSETRRTDTHIPEPYAIQVGNPTDIPQGYEEGWFLNVHSIDTRGVVDRMGCTECRCDLYNMTINGYLGGLECCLDQGQCRLRKGFQNITRDLYLRYTVKWVEWVDTIVPVRIFIFDVTDTGPSGCQIEYDVKSCGVSGHGSSSQCLDREKSSVVVPKGGYVVYGVGHQHAGGIGLALYGEDGRKICSSKAIYGNGTEPGNESGYIVGMTTCYPQPGTVKISDGEKVQLKSIYNNSQMHTGVMGLFYLLVADYPSKSTLP